jgi:hypothetical protein
VQKFSSKGVFLKALKPHAAHPVYKSAGAWSELRGISSDRNGGVWIIHRAWVKPLGTYSTNIVKLDTELNVVGGLDWSTYAPGKKIKRVHQKEGLWEPYDLDIDGDGNIYVLDWKGQKVTKWNNDGYWVATNKGSKPWGGGYWWSRNHYYSYCGPWVKAGTYPESWDEVASSDRRHSRIPSPGPRSDYYVNACTSTFDGKVSWPKGIAVAKSGGGTLARKAVQQAYKVNQQLTADKDKIREAMKEWAPSSAPGGYGGDWPEANLFALHQLATEGGKTDGLGYSDPETGFVGEDTDDGFSSCGRDGVVQDPDWLKEKGPEAGDAPFVDPWSLDAEKRRRACPEGSVGWREEAGRVVVWFGDAPSHNTTVTREEAINALNARGIVVAGLIPDPRTQVWMPVIH